MITIHGASDDLIEVAGHQREEFNVYGDSDIGWPVRVHGDDGELTVVMRYGDRGCWSAEVQMPGEDQPLPWPVSITAAENRCAYSVFVHIDCPDDVVAEVAG